MRPSVQIHVEPSRVPKNCQSVQTREHWRLVFEGEREVMLSPREERG